MQNKKNLLVVLVVLVVALGLVTYWFVQRRGSLSTSPQPSEEVTPPSGELPVTPSESVPTTGTEPTQPTPGGTPAPY